MNNSKKNPHSLKANLKKKKIEDKAIKKAVKRLFAEKRRKILRKENQWKTGLIE